MLFVFTSSRWIATSPGGIGFPVLMKSCRWEMFCRGWRFRRRSRIFTVDLESRKILG
jgi:hypothetical protein